MELATSRIIRDNLPKNVIQPRRGQIYVGFKCHQRCGFCYYKHSCNDPMFSFEKVKKQIDFEYEYGIREFEITGGEPAEYEQLNSICQYIKLKDSSCKIAIITNGSLWKSDIWKLIDEVLVSYHLGKNDKDYNKQMFPLGSTYDKVAKTIEKARQNNVFLRTNTVLGTFNIQHINSIVDDLIEFKPSIVNFLPVNLFDQAKDMVQFIDYKLFRMQIKQAIDRLTAEGINNINVRYMPFCEMEGYEQYVVGTLQHIYDSHDWNRELGGTEILNMIDNKEYYLSKFGKYGSTSIDKSLEIRKTTYSKTRECLTCKYNILCDGVERTKDNMLEKYIVPSHGKIIKNILNYRHYDAF